MNCCAPPGLVGSLSLSLTFLLGQQVDLQRTDLCTLHVQAHFVMLYVFSTTLYFSLWWRAFLVLYPRGFVRDGSTNLKLFSQLFWLLLVVGMSVQYTGELVLQLQGNYPQGSMQGR